MEAIGYLGALLLGICGFPEMIRTIKDNRCHLGWTFLMMWFFGEIFMLVYTYNLKDIPLTGNYLFNCLILSVMVTYKVKQEIKKL
jgi:hypothetical protein